MKRLFNNPRIFFWGDLDKEGLRIYASLRRKLPRLRASALYQPMIEAMQQGTSHPYVRATAKERQGDADNVPCDVSSLVPLCKERGVDQEIVSTAVIAELAPTSLEEVCQSEGRKTATNRSNC
ncbi:Wadjet anti-phage system protein JetD domain-containing protein [Pusillimonas sp.]|uniref:Wadjet anti-phage system protein JetD domain-containing protein n=1 Tax=Pusillimonas sp. TaxID=3040095 RepID=UPI0039B8E350